MTTAGTPDRPLAPLLRAAVLPSLVAGVVCASAAAATAGVDALLGALLGSALVVGFFWAGQATLEAVRSVRPELFLVIALLTYTLQVVVLLAVFASFRRNESWSEHVSTTTLGLTVIACTWVWTVGLIVASRRQRVPLFDVGGDL